MQQEVSNIFLTLLPYLAGIIIALAAWMKPIYEWYTSGKKTLAEADSITTTASMSTQQMTEKMLRDWMVIADEAADKLVMAKVRIGEAQVCLREMLELMRQANIAPDILLKLEAKIDAIFKI